MGSIDCDPASSDTAQRIVKAKTYYTLETNGLNQIWEGNIFLNQPYEHPAINHYVDKLLYELKDGQQAILLTNDQTDTNFFHKAANRADAVCFHKGRIKFYDQDGITQTNPTNGQVFFYFGDNPQRFAKIFSKFGIIMRRYDEH
jgi:ParB family chromosome partitioning protein